MWWLLAIPFLFSKKGTSSSSSSSSSSPAMMLDADSVLARFTAGIVMATLYARPRPTWRVVKASGEIIGQGAGRGASDLVRPMLESFAEATPGLPIQAQFLDVDRWLSIFVFPAEASGEHWAWSFTDGVQTVSGEPQEKRGQALLAALSRIEDGPPKADESEADHG